MNACLRNPARASVRRRSLARLVEWNPAITLACSRLFTRITSKDSNKRRSRSCSTRLIRLFPAMQDLLSFPGVIWPDATSDFPLDISAASGPAGSATGQQTLVVGAGRFKGRHHHAGVMMMAGFDDQISLGQVLEDFRQVFCAVQRCGHLVGIATGKLKKNVCANRHDGGAHPRWVLIEELIGGDYPDTELAGFRKQSIEAAVKGNQVLDFIAVKSKELPAMAGKQCVLDFGQEQAAQGGGVVAEPALVEVQNDPVAAINGVD